MTGFTLTRHAIQRALDMAVDPEEIRDAWNKPRDTHKSGTTGADYLTRGRITLVTRGDVVVTIMWARQSDWVADHEIGGYDTRQQIKTVSRAAQKARKKR
jgi:hypothetical protein